MRKTSNLKRLACRLLATTCLIAAGNVAAIGGGTVAIPEDTYTSYPGDLLLSNTTTVTGTVNEDITSAGDFFEFEGLTGGESFSSLGLAINDLSDNGMRVELFADTPSAETVILGITSISALSTLDPTGTVPSDGKLIVNILPTNQDEFATNYSVTLSTATPEPATLATLGLGLVGIGVLDLRRRRKN
jgi:hypothetical protein